MATHTSTETHEIPTSDLVSPGRSGGEVLVEAMRELGVDVAFGVISIHNLPLVEAVDRELRFVPVRHEAAAVNAADGWARVTGKVGVAITSTGTGAGNAAGAMLEALTAESRVLHVTGNIDSAHLGEDRGMYHEVPRQLGMLTTVSAHALRVERARDARKVLAEAAALLAQPPYGPVSVDWPIDLQYDAAPAKQRQGRASTPKSPTASRRDVAAAVKAMAAARRPLIWAGGGARRVGRPLVELAQAWSAGVVTGGGGRGSVPEDHPQCLGNFPTSDALVELIGRADCLLTIGSHLRAHETRNFELPLPAEHVQIDVDPDALGRNFPITLGLHADATQAVPELLAALSEVETEPGWLDEVDAAREAARRDHRGDIGAYGGICDSIRARLPRNAPIVRDVTIPGSSWGNRLLEVYSPNENVFAAGGGIGQGLAMAVGAGVARPGVPTLAIIGDGGFAVHLGELATLAAEQPHVIVALFNDGGYGVLRNLQQAKDDEARAVDLVTPDFKALARAFRLPYNRTASVRGFDRALASAVDRRGPSLIEIDVAALRPRPASLIPPINVD